MREILFRGIWVHGNNEWIEGDLVRDSEGNPHIVDSEYNEYWDGDPIFVCEEECMVKPETVGQYTGLLDKDGKKIFEGDIVKNEYRKGQYQYFKIVYDTRVYCWQVENKYGMLGFLYNVIGDLEVIGNIHDNKKLLEVK